MAAYAFAVPDGDGGSSDPVTQAGDLLSYLGSDAATVPLMLDVEYDRYASRDGTNECYGLTPSAMVAWISAFAGELQATTGVLRVRPAGRLLHERGGPAPRLGAAGRDRRGDRHR